MPDILDPRFSSEVRGPAKSRPVDYEQIGSNPTGWVPAPNRVGTKLVDSRTVGTEGSTPFTTVREVEGAGGSEEPLPESRFSLDDLRNQINAQSARDIIDRHAGSQAPQVAPSGPAEESATRGTPTEASPSHEEPNLLKSFYDKGEARINALTQIFGQDALVLGHLVFQVPPLALRIKKGNITYRWKPLRTRESIAVKSGNGECYIEIDLIFVGVDQIKNSLGDLIALWKKVPFCFIENSHIRNMMIPNSPQDSMAVCLETLVMDAVSGRPNTVYATLITKWFNYKPYSNNFWFRQTWRPAEGPVTTPLDPELVQTPLSPQSNTPRLTDTILVDLSAIENPNILRQLRRELPPEVGLLESKPTTNTGDPLMDPTYPVVYPFNSEAFLSRIRTGRDTPPRIRGWSDGIEMRWNSFIKRNLPRGYSEVEPTTQVAAAHPRTRSASAGPTPVTGDRDILIFMGDSIMVGFTGLLQDSDTKDPGNWNTPTFRFWEPDSNQDDYFPPTSGIRYLAMCRVGLSSGNLKRWWDLKKEDPALQTEENPSVFNRVAGVLIHCGTNEGPTGPAFSHLEYVAKEIAKYGALPIICQLPPSGEHPDNGKISSLAKDPPYWGESTYASYATRVTNSNDKLKKIAEDNNGKFINYNEQMVESSYRNNSSPPLAVKYQASISSRYYDIHWNTEGKKEGGTYIHGQLPWNSLKPAEGPESELWTVCHVEDGDTIWLWGTPEGGDKVLRNVRLKYIDTPETYSTFEDDTYSALVEESTSVFVDEVENTYEFADSDIGDWVVNHPIRISGATNSENNGTFLITERISSTVIKTDNTNTVDEQFTGHFSIYGGDSPLPEGQDSYRPESAKFGKIAKEALAQKVPEGSQVTVTWDGTGYYGRYLGILFKDGENINAWAITHGLGFLNLPNTPTNSEDENWIYHESDLKARGQWPQGGRPQNGARGVHTQREVALEDVPSFFPEDVKIQISRLLTPQDFRKDFPPSSDGGHGSLPPSCAQSIIQAEWEEASEAAVEAPEERDS